MPISLSTLLATLSSIFCSRASLLLENLALRHQIGVLKRSAKKCPKLTSGDRLLWICLSRLWGGWHSALAIVKPETVVAWHRAAFRLFWTWKVRRGQPGRPLFSRKVRDLICKMCRENPDTLHIHHPHVRTGEPTQDRRWKIICPMSVLRSAMWCSS